VCVGTYAASGLDCYRRVRVLPGLLRVRVPLAFEPSAVPAGARRVAEVFTKGTLIVTPPSMPHWPGAVCLANKRRKKSLFIASLLHWLLPKATMALS